ncbi:MAG: SCP2 sterol-binding domain-containing protein [Myxococcales bacterium]|nr:SCP2 sterol-binding domain-containing protein [Myxococcales bacterium]MDH3486104.1 SCP2 sterol-binding domain-containing protein [Myxococcales bacterium]
MAKVANTQEYFSTLAERFVADGAKGVTATMQYSLSGDGGGDWVVTIDDGEFKGVESGIVDKPTLHIMMDAAKFIEMANGDLDGRKAFLTRKLKVKGNIALAQKMQKFFPQG